ncbi:hypothetical protein AMJ87_11315 [candidate division WOR_3 bacterium SM23_60]|uniref:Uncharacterized protein n=1 Tax=candidate division WOR_3 bacterium SM23_60 TaxID=1703780 RepID=A0A0S8G807_UNCW3|nr:MAG: hypothetical protein AMJ87_11315 [candidate division WOR_3 bacterium SM23_60]
MSGTIDFEYDEARNILFTKDQWEIRTKEDVDAFFEEYRKYFEKLNKKVYMVSRIDGLLVHADIAEYYGETARRTVYKYLLGYARWGANDWARMTVRTTSLKAKMEPHIYSTREEAAHAIENMKKSAKNS